jgi:intracellular multiplication protein IcmB
MLFKILHQLWGDINRSVQDFCDIETVDNNTLVANDGSLATIVKLNGFKTIMSAQDVEEACSAISITLSPFLGKLGHQLQIVFTRDDEEHEELEEIRTIKKSTAKRLNLELDGLIDESIDKYAEYVYNESCYFVFWSRPLLLNSVEIKEKSKKEIETRIEHKLPPMAYAQNIAMDTSFLMQQHLSFVNTVQNKLNQLKFCADVLDAGNMLYAIKKNILPARTTRNWKASFPTQPIPLRWKTLADNDMSELMYPNIASQIMTANAVEGDKQLLDDTLVKFGERIYSPLLFEIPPINPQYFNELFNTINRIQIRNRHDKIRALPYSICLMIEGGGLTGFSLNAILSSMLGFASSTNRNINSAKEALNHLKENNQILTKFKISACTWACVGTSEVKDLALRKANLIKALESWGNGKVIDKTGSPMEALQSNSLGLSYKHIANGGAAPLDDVLRMLPITRPANIFKNGTITYRSKDGKLFRYQRFSSEQTTWITLITGRPGFGKSVLMNDGNIELCVSAGLNELPYICNIDIGVTSQGMIELIRESLPNDKKHLAMYTRLQNSPEFSVNPFDTALGCRMPLPKDKSYLINFLTMLATPAERKGSAYEGMSDFVSRIIDMVYTNKAGISDRSNPNRYTAGHNPWLDEILYKHDLYHHGVTYWEVVDRLFEKEEFYAAEIAQRYAVPLLDDCVSMAASIEIMDEYKKSFTESGTPIYEAFQIGVRGGISQFPLFAGITQFDIGSAKIMSLDLNDVTSSGKTDNEFKQNALMYMMARQCFMKKVAFSKEDILYIPKTYTAYYTKLIDSLIDAYKTLCYDEYHRTGNVPAIENQTLTDARESRKWQMELVVASQFLEDMGDIANIATNIFICDAGTTASRKYMTNKIGLTNVQESALINNCTGPNEHGMSFLAIQDSRNSSKIYQVYTLTIGAKRLWGLSTTAEDRRLRNLLMTKGPMTRDQALDILAQKFPNGSCKKMVELQKQAMNNSSNSEAMTSSNNDDDELNNSIVENIAKNLLQNF